MSLILEICIFIPPEKLHFLELKSPPSQKKGEEAESEDSAKGKEETIKIIAAKNIGIEIPEATSIMIETGEEPRIEENQVDTLRTMKETRREGLPNLNQKRRLNKDQDQNLSFRKKGQSQNQEADQVLRDIEIIETIIMIDSRENEKKDLEENRNGQIN